jgi:hypothetical protein
MERKKRHGGEETVPETRAPYLPTTPKWEEADFTLKNLIHHENVTSVRRWVLRLLERYRFVIGTWL